MKKILILIMVILTFCLIGCSNVSVSNASLSSVKYRFVTITSERGFDVVYDSETKVQYSKSTGGYNFGTLTLLVDSEGKPLLYEED